MSSTSTAGQQPGATQGGAYDKKEFANSNESDNIIDVTEETSSWIVRADPSNSGVIYIGWDDNVTADNGFPLESGDVISSDIDNSVQAVYGVADTGGDNVRFLTVR